jgi:hypothetical protein
MKTNVAYCGAESSHRVATFCHLGGKVVKALAGSLYEVTGSSNSLTNLPDRVTESSHLVAGLRNSVAEPRNPLA